MYKISIIVPVYNVENYLRRCVNSILNQTYENKEIILVDDESSDKSGQICEEFAASNHNIKVIHVKNGGPNKACYEGLMVSAGDFICFCDSDDWLEPHMLSAMSGYLTGDRKQIVCCNFLIEDKNGTRKGGCHGALPGVYEDSRLEKEILGELLGHENRKISMSRCMKLFSRSLLEDNTQHWDFRLRMGDDMTIVIPAILDSQRIVIMEGAAFYHYLFVESSIVHKYNKGLYENIQYLKSVLEKILRGKGAYSGEKVEKEYMYLLMLVLKNEARGSLRGSIKRICHICKAEDTKREMKQYQVKTETAITRMTAFVMKHPNFCTAGIYVMLLRVYDNIRK